MNVRYLIEFEAGKICCTSFLIRRRELRGKRARILSLKHIEGPLISLVRVDKLFDHPSIATKKYGKPHMHCDVPFSFVFIREVNHIQHTSINRRIVIEFRNIIKSNHRKQWISAKSFRKILQSGKEYDCMNNPISSQVNIAVGEDVPVTGYISSVERATPTKSLEISSVSVTAVVLFIERLYIELICPRVLELEYILIKEACSYNFRGLFKSLQSGLS